MLISHHHILPHAISNVKGANPNTANCTLMGCTPFLCTPFVFVVMRATDTNVGAIDAPDDVVEARHGIAFGFGNLGVRSPLKLHIYVNRACQHVCDPVYSSAHSGFADAERITDIYLEPGRRKHTQRHHDLHHRCQPSLSQFGEL